ncbi:hypothetical protein P4923_07490 [Bacillus halotolerans]|nr:hypothetical protein [Bacillus halotolerans]MEC0357550.1 hypothetical protein [Bacillus halotolerans]
MTFDHADVQLAEGNAILKDHVTGEEQVLPKSSTEKMVVLLHYNTKKSIMAF